MSPTKLHTKLVVLDDVVHIGSSNLDIRSLYLNMELMLRVDDGEFAADDAQLFRGRAGAVRADHAGSAEAARDLAQPDPLGDVSFFLVTSFDYGVTRRLNFGLEGD